MFEDYKYLPWQPGFERTAGRYRGRIAESQDGMAGIVADFYEIDGRKLREGKIPVIPDGCTDLILSRVEEKQKCMSVQGCWNLRIFSLQIRRVYLV